MAPTVTSRISIPSYPVVGLWIQVSTNVVFGSHSLTKAQADNGRFPVIHRPLCLFRSGGSHRCDSPKMNPNIAYPRGQNFTLQPTDYMIGPTSGSPNMCLTWPRASKPTSDGIEWQLGTFCTAYLRTYAHSCSFLGTAFLRSVYTIYE